MQDEGKTPATQSMTHRDIYFLERPKKTGYLQPGDIMRNESLKKAK